MSGNALVIKTCWYHRYTIESALSHFTITPLLGLICRQSKWVVFVDQITD